MYFFRCNFDDRKFMLFSPTFFDVISLVKISTVFLLTFCDVILMVKKSSLFTRTFFDEISMGKNSMSFLVSCKLIKKHSRRFYFDSSFKKLTFARFFSFNFLCKSSWCSPVPLKFESFNLQHCKKNCHKLVFWVFTEQLHYQIIFGSYIAIKLLL